MARKRMIDPSFWDDLNVAKLSIAARLCFIGMVSNADDEGRIEAEPRYIKRAVFGFDDELSSTDVAGLLAEIQHACPSVVFYQVDGRALASFTNWKRYQYIQKPQPSRLPPVPLPDEYDNDTVPVSPSGRERNRKEKNRKEANDARARLEILLGNPDQAAAAVAAAVRSRGDFTLGEVEICEAYVDRELPTFPKAVGALYNLLKAGKLPSPPPVPRTNGHHPTRPTARLPDQPDLHWAEDERGKYLALADGTRYEVPDHDTPRVSR